MAKKTKTFAEKAAGRKSFSQVCPECGTAFTAILVVDSEKNEATGAWKFTNTQTKVCNCNGSKVYA